MRLENRVAIITGSGGGIGKAYAQVFAKEGAKVIIAEYNEEKGKETANELCESGFEASFIKCNVAEEKDVNNLVAEVIKKYGKIDILVNNAQATDSNALPVYVEETSVDLVKLCWNTGFFGTFLLTKACIPYMKEKKYGRIINTASATGVKGMETFSAYGSQKEAIRGLTRITAQEYGDFGITANCVCPGALTDAAKLWKEYDPASYEEALKPQAIKRLGDPIKDIAPLALFLASEESQFVTGQTIGVDGGTTKMQ
ncbi:MAG: SDR family NAD(P)-dependent oxidoreductase [Thomasclavelia sp.]|jgi:NAD(P)-dependent dehydrogenase (short-subunit alcohol dehydrogenase family)|nr:SDR family NAD(P)-dependent oxidoreductase [Thomasclavelia sp.]